MLSDLRHALRLLQGYSLDRARVFYRTLLERAAATPGVRDVTLARIVPLSGVVYVTSVTLPGLPDDAEPQAPRAAFNSE